MVFNPCTGCIHSGYMRLGSRIYYPGNYFREFGITTIDPINRNGVNSGDRADIHQDRCRILPCSNGKI